jgi:tRNA modification GTPase
MNFDDTIFALSSGAGIAGVAVIRVSGPAAGPAIASLSGKTPTERRATLRLLRDPRSKEILDRGIVLWLPAPASATGEDMAEFHLHGSQAVIQGVIEALGALPGMRLAEPGEFTKRSLANGKLDLVEVEGLADLLRAESAGQRRQSLHHLLGEASSAFEDWRLRLIAILARVEALIEFHDEDGTIALAASNAISGLEVMRSDMEREIELAGRAFEVRRGLRIAIAGRPNTGKSSLFNCLLRREAAIVSVQAGTTRDVLESGMEIGGLKVVVSDMAGLREDSRDEIEEVGIGRAQGEIGRADIVLWVWSEDIEGSWEPPAGVIPSLWVRNKCDLDVESESRGRLSGTENIAISALGQRGIEELTFRLKDLIRTRYDRAENAVIVRVRQKQAVEESIRFMNDAIIRSELELVAEDLRLAARSLARVTGRVDVEDLLTEIFSEFCIGK